MQHGKKKNQPICARFCLVEVLSKWAYCRTEINDIVCLFNNFFFRDKAFVAFKYSTVSTGDRESFLFILPGNKPGTDWRCKFMLKGWNSCSGIITGDFLKMFSFCNVFKIILYLNCLNVILLSGEICFCLKTTTEWMSHLCVLIVNELSLNHWLGFGLEMTLMTISFQLFP